MKAFCCVQCYEEISSKDKKSADVWANLCQHHVNQKGLFRLIESRSPWLIPRFIMLERNNYITTVDYIQGVLVRVNGYELKDMDEQNKNVHTFCLNRTGHKKNA